MNRFCYGLSKVSLPEMQPSYSLSCIFGKLTERQLQVFVELHFWQVDLVTTQVICCVAYLLCCVFGKLSERPFKVFFRNFLQQEPNWQQISDFLFCFFVLFVVLKKRIPLKICILPCFAQLKNILFNLFCVSELKFCSLSVLQLNQTVHQH